MQMNIIEELKALFENGGLLNIFTSINPIIDRKFIEEKCSIIISEKKYLNLWVIESIESIETDFSINRNLIEQKISISGYFGISNENNSFNLFSSLSNTISDQLRKNIPSSEEYLKIVSVTKSEISKKMFGNILCHNQNTIVSLKWLKNKMEQ